MLQFNHFNFNVLDLERSLAFYRQALELEVVEEKEAGDGSFKLVYLGDGETGFRLECQQAQSAGLLTAGRRNFSLKSVRIPAKKLLASSHNPSLLGTSPSFKQALVWRGRKPRP